MNLTDTSSHIKVRFHEQILEIEIDRREKKNALTSAMYQSLKHAIHDGEANPEVHVIYIHAQEDLFTSGNDLNEFINPSQADASAAFDFLKIIANCQKPLVAAVGGKAIGIGTTLLLHCDFVIATEDAQFQLPFVNLGLSPEGASSYILPLIAGTKLSNELLMLGNYFDSKTAYRAGIISQICSKEQLLTSGLEICQQLAIKPVISLKSSKKLIKKHHIVAINETIEDEFNEFIQLLQQPAAKEILLAFIEKRPPNRALFKPSSNN
jgi:enoyl-CoA hydratase/carnithine racemase